MSRGLSLSLRQALFAQETDEAPLVLLTFESEEMEGALRLTSDAVNTISNRMVEGEPVAYTFLAFPFDISIPDDSPDRPPQAQISIDNVDRQITYLLESISTPVRVTIEVVLASDPDTVEASWSGLELRQVKYDALKVQGTLTYENLRREPYPKGVFSPSYFPAMF